MSARRPEDASLGLLLSLGTSAHLEVAEGASYIFLWERFGSGFANQGPGRLQSGFGGWRVAGPGSVPSPVKLSFWSFSEGRGAFLPPPFLTAPHHSPRGCVGGGKQRCFRKALDAREPREAGWLRLAFPVLSTCSCQRPSDSRGSQGLPNTHSCWLK